MHFAHTLPTCRIILGSPLPPLQKQYEASGLCIDEVMEQYLRQYLLTPWSRVLLEKLTGSAASQEIPRIFGARSFLTVLTSARHLSLF